jgi:hypothetical protein
VTSYRRQTLGFYGVPPRGVRRISYVILGLLALGPADGERVAVPEGVVLGEGTYKGPESIYHMMKGPPSGPG